MTRLYCYHGTPKPRVKNVHFKPYSHISQQKYACPNDLEHVCPYLEGGNGKARRGVTAVKGDNGKAWTRVYIFHHVIASH